MKLAGLVVLGAVLVAAGCGSPDIGSAPIADGSTSATPTPSSELASTHHRVEPSADNRVTDGDQADLLLGPWLLVSGSVEEQPIPAEPDLVMRFGVTILSFPLSCNSGAVPYEVNGTSIRFDLDHFSTTEMACAPDPTNQANLFEIGLRRVATATVSTDGQQLEFAGDAVTMQFARGTGG